MRKAHLVGCAALILMGACGSSDDGSVDAKPQPKQDVAVPNTATDTAQAAPDVAGTGPKLDTAPQGTPDVGLGNGSDAPSAVKLDGGTTGARLDAGIDSGETSGPDGKPDVAMDTRGDTTAVAPDARADAGTVPDVNAAPDASPEAGNSAYDGGLGSSCIKGLFGLSVVRWDGVTIDESSPTSPQVVFEASTGLPLTGVIGLQQGKSHACAALSSGTVECWPTKDSGGNILGQLGNGTTTDVRAIYRATAVLTGPGAPLANVVSMVPSLETNVSCAVTGDGKLWCWGDLTYLANKGAGLHAGYAKAITTDGSTALSGVSSAALGLRQACAIVAGPPSTLWCWGRNGGGELGQGDTSHRWYPTKVPGLTNPTKVALSYDEFEEGTTCAVDGGNVKCWGANYAGQVGSAVASAHELSPTTVVVDSGSALDGVTDIVPGFKSFAVLRSTGTIWAWGSGYRSFAANYGQTNVLAIGWAGPASNSGPRFLTSDGVYHNGTSTIAVNCGAL